MSEVTEEKKKKHYLSLKWVGKAKLKNFPAYVYIYILKLDLQIYDLPCITCSCRYSSANVR